MKSELKTLAERMEEMQKEIRKFQDIESVKIDGNEKLKNLNAESATLEKKTKAFSEIFKVVQIEHEKAKV
jgi:hypothetical protein